MRPLNRWAPALPVTAMKTYHVSTPRETHFRQATCAEVECEQYTKGWATTVLPDSQEEHLIKQSGRKWFRKETTPEGMVRYLFGQGQPCFASIRHRVPLEKPALYVVRDGDWRGNPTGRRARFSEENWIDSFKNDNQAVIDRRNAG